jgi:hypothetical protein
MIIGIRSAASGDSGVTPLVLPDDGSHYCAGVRFLGGKECERLPVALDKKLRQHIETARIPLFHDRSDEYTWLGACVTIPQASNPSEP